MPRKTSRRDFLGLSAVGLAAAAAPNQLLNAASKLGGQQGGPSSAGSEISMWVTSGDAHFEPAPKLTWNSGPQASEHAFESNQITLNPSTKFQQILGFGGAFTDATCYMFNQLSPAARDQLFHELFHPSEMGFSIGRVCVGSSDYSTKLYSYDDGEADPDLKRFSIEHDRSYILPMLRLARKVSPDLFLFSTPWSPPGWMKFNRSMLGGAMRNNYFAVMRSTT